MTTDANNPLVIVGAGLAGAKAAQTLREEGYDGPLVLIGDEAERPYERPPLSKGYLLGKEEREKIFVHPESWYAEHDVELRLDTTVSALDTDAHRLTFADGGHLDYSKLLLTTGASPRQLPVINADLEGVRYLRRVEDSEKLKEAFQQGTKVVVIGAGWIGLETAAAARAAGAEVTVLETADLPLLRVLGPEVAQIFANLHRAHDVDMRFGVNVVEITGSLGKADGVLIGGGGGRIVADVVVVGIGAAPNVALAEAAGLVVDNGIVTDEHLRTSAPDVFAAGDVANAFHPFFGKRVRVEHWANALNQPQTAAKAMLGRDVAYDRLPYFYSDQYDLGMEYTGHAEPDGYDQVVFRGDVEAREFIAFWLSEGRVIAGMNVNVWDVTDPIKALINSRTVVDVEALADPGVALESLVASSG
jgi:3-phenylpropionate/trans-cinnamate dioxygenase ferredoxin reductase component